MIFFRIKRTKPQSGQSNKCIIEVHWVFAFEFKSNFSLHYSALSNKALAERAINQTSRTNKGEFVMMLWWSQTDHSSLTTRNNVGMICFRKMRTRHIWLMIRKFSNDAVRRFDDVWIYNVVIHLHVFTCKERKTKSFHFGGSQKLLSTF